MDSTLINLLNKRQAWYGVLSRYSYFLIVLCGLLVIGAGSAYILRPYAPADLATGNQLMRSGFYTDWQQGNLVVVMRHVERCDHSTNPCLAQADGITRKGQGIARQLGQSIRAMDLSSADIYNSPLRRTEQTSSLVFNRTSPAQDWLINCRKTMLDDVLKHKLDQRNLILVTHSECIAQLEKSLNVSGPATLDYGSSLILSVDPKTHSPRVLGVIDALSWGRVLAQRP